MVTELSKNDYLNVIGTTGLKETGGFINEEFLATLRGREGVKYYTEMIHNSSILGAIMFIIDMMVRRVNWTVNTADGEEDNPAAIREKEFVESILMDMDTPFEDLISEALTMLPYGWSYFEVTYKIRRGQTKDKKTRSLYSDGRWGIRKIDTRAQDTLWRWIFDEEGSLLGMEQNDVYRGSQGTVFIPIEKSVLFRTRSAKGNPEGFPLLRPAAPDYAYLKRIKDIEAVGLERELTGMPLMEVPRELLLTNASATDQYLRSQLETMITQIRANQRWGGLLPSELDNEGKPTGFKFRVQTTGGKRSVEADPVIRRYESRIAMVFLAEFIQIGTDKVGTEALHRSKSTLFKSALETILTDMIAATLNKRLIGRLMSLNKVDPALWPRVLPGRIDSPDIEILGKYVLSLAQSGLLSPGNRRLENKMLTDAGLPTPESSVDVDLFDNPDVITPRDQPDQTSGVMSPTQIDAIMKINKAISSREITRSAAEELAASALGMSTQAVSRYLVEEPEPRETPPPLAPQVAPNPEQIPAGSLTSDNDTPQET